MNQTLNKSQEYIETSWRALQYFNLYRFLISLLFVGLIWIGQLPEPLGVYDQKLFAFVAHGYLLASIVIAVVISMQMPRYKMQVAVHVLIDIIAISLMMYASNGLDSGFGMLLIIAVAGGSILCAGRIAILFAAIAALAVLSQEVYLQLFRYYPPPNYTHAGLLGITFFATAILGHILAARVEKSEALVKQHEVNLESLARLNEIIVQRMQAGIIVLDDEYRVRLSNESARMLLGLRENINNRPIADVAPEITGQLKKWSDEDGKYNVSIKPSRGEVDIQVSFTQLKSDTKFGILIFLEDLALMRQRAQQLKLASLGRLTASIAHEVRNPLGAITHASQLLSEAGQINNEDNRLIEIIMDQSRRVNTIIENVQHISRREPATPQLIEIKPWLAAFVNELTARKNIPKEKVKYSIKPEAIMVRMDSSQLYQVLWNLSENAIRYSTGNILLELHCGIKKDSQRAYIDIMDHGPGIKEEVIEHLFEPFFTTNPMGTGLGLYIASELCEANQASLNLYNNSDAGCCFRIHFPHMQKQHNVI
jgi:two-component system sensor histidine kinase PilS (NtrC family)